MNTKRFFKQQVLLLFIKQTSVAPLHISLGLGLKNLNVVEEIAVNEDNKIKEAMGITSDTVADLLSKRDKIYSELDELFHENSSLSSRQMASENSLKMLKSNNEFAFEKDNNKFKDKSKDAISIRKRATELKRTIDKLANDIKENEKQQKFNEENLKDTLDQVDKEKEPFKTELDTVLDSFKLERTVYHSGALIGKDVDKLTKPENINKICNIFRPRSIVLADKTEQIFGSYQLAQLLKTRLTKFRYCYQLYMANRYLCRHEVLKLCVRAYSFGNWLPVNFTQESLSRKFHMLTYEVPRKALLCHTVGLEAEHCSEAIHPFCNKWNRLYRTVQNKKGKLVLIAKAQWLASNPNLDNFNNTKTRVCPKCKLQSHYRKSCREMAEIMKLQVKKK